MAEAAYDTIGRGYATQRRPDPRIAAAIDAAPGDAASLINVGAGTGSYEPADREVLAIEPSAVMRSQRPAGAARCIEGVAEALPVGDASFDVALAVLTLHHWTDQAAGLRELRRVAWWPAAYLDPAVRASISSFHDFDPRPGVARLADDLASGAWAARNADVLDRDSLDLGYRLFTCELGPA